MTTSPERTYQPDILVNDLDVVFCGINPAVVETYAELRAFSR